MLLGVVGGLKSGERGLVAVAQCGVMLLAQASEVSARRGRHLGRVGGGLGGDVGDLCGDLPGGAGGLDENAGIVVDGEGGEVVGIEADLDYGAMGDAGDRNTDCRAA